MTEGDLACISVDAANHTFAKRTAAVISLDWGEDIALELGSSFAGGGEQKA